MNDFHVTRYERSTGTSSKSNRKMSRSDLAFQKLKKYEEKYKTNRNLTPIRTNSMSFEADSESDIEQYKSLIPLYAGPRDTQRDSQTNFEAPKQRFQEVEDLVVVKSLENGNTICNNRPRVVANKSHIIDQVDNVHFVHSGDSKSALITNSLPNTCQERNRKSRKKSFDTSKDEIHENTPSVLKTTANNNSIESDIFDDRQITPRDNHTTKPEGDRIYSRSNPADNKIYFRNNKNESKNVDLHPTDEIREMQEPSQSVEYCQKQNKNESLRQINSYILSNREELPVGTESIRTEVCLSNSDVTSYEIPDISNSFDMDIRDKSESSHLDAVDTSKSYITSDAEVPQNTDDKTVTVPAASNVTDGHLNSPISLCPKCKFYLKKYYKSQKDETNCHCKTTSTQTNINLDVLHHMNNVQLLNTTGMEDLVLSPYSLFIYHYLLRAHSKDLKENSDPARSFLNKTLMEHVSITQYLINNQHALYNAYCTAARNLSKNYHPVTLENTMQFIKQNKKKKRNKMVSP